MKRKVTIEFEIDPTEHKELDTDGGAVQIACAIMAGEADVPNKLIITSGSVTQHLNKAK